MKDFFITSDIKFLSVNHKDIDLFENHYTVPNGISYNSYLILDEKVTLMDTVDARMEEEWFALLEKELGDRTLDYVVITHMEPDHAGCLGKLIAKYPDIKIVGTAGTFKMIELYFEYKDDSKSIVVKENDTLSLGKHTLQFFMAPMVHWPEVMVAYEQTNHILFSADAFGKFDTLDIETDWLEEARRYYINIVGKFGKNVQALLKKVEPLQIDMICSLHGPVLKENIPYYYNKYDIWSNYNPEEEGVLVAYTSVYGNTEKAVFKIVDMLKENGVEKIELLDLTHTDISKAVAYAFRFPKMILASTTYETGLFPAAEEFLTNLKRKNYQNRYVGLIENGSWAPMAAKVMKSNLESMNNITICPTVVTIKAALKDENLDAMNTLAKAIADYKHSCLNVDTACN